MLKVVAYTILIEHMIDNDTLQEYTKKIEPF